MDNKKFGQFILKLRKEKGWTQLELAEKLNITDKAVSKWERGTGFPDIKMIEPLAEVFNVSILEIMQSERIPGQTIPKDNASEAINNVIDSEAINNVIDVVAFQRKIERRNIIITATAFSTLIMLLFLIDTMQLEGFMMICLPLIMLGTGLYLTGLSIYRARHHLTYAATLPHWCPEYWLYYFRYLFFCFYALLSYWADRFRLRRNKDSRKIFSAVRSSIPLRFIPSVYLHTRLENTSPSVQASLAGRHPMKTQKNTGKNASTLP